MLKDFFGWIIGADTQKTLDMVGAGIDKAFYTDEEKAIAGQKILDAKLIAIKQRSVPRRIIALLVTVHALLFLDVAAILHLMGYVEQAKFVFGLMTDFLLTPFTAVLGFYFLIQFKKG